MTFYERLINVLKERNIKQVRFYSELYLSRQTVVSWKKGSIPNVETFLKICKYLNVSPYYLYFGIEENEELKLLRDKAAKYDEMILLMNTFLKDKIK